MLTSIGMIVFIAIVVIGLVYISYTHCKRWNNNQSYAFITKLTESYGFFCIMSILNAPIGILLVFLAQHWNLHQRKSKESDYIENTKVKKRGGN